MCARSYVFVYSVHRLSFKRSSTIQFTQNSISQMLKCGSHETPVLTAHFVCVCARADTRPPNLQTNSKAEEADDASGAATAPTDNEVCL